MAPEEGDPEPPGVAGARMILLRTQQLRREAGKPDSDLIGRAIEELPKVARDHARLFELLK
ncbi:MAG: hypothetical protein WB789_06250 [Thermoplasmata archaeon]